MALLFRSTVDSAARWRAQLTRLTQELEVRVWPEIGTPAEIDYALVWRPEPGFLASLHINATIAPDVPFERLFIDLESSPLHDLVEAKDGKVTVPDGPGLGRDPDMEVMHRYLVSDPTVHRG